MKRPNYGFARRQGATAAEFEKGITSVVHRPDVSVTALAEIQRLVDGPMELRALESDEYNALLQRLYQHGADDAHQLAADFGEDSDLKSLAEALPETEDLLEAEDDAPIIRLINALLTEAVKENASDIHIEPFENRLVVRMRVDGVLREVLSPQRHLAPLLASRIKVMARLDIAEKRLPQDGRISLKVAGRPVDVRVSTVPAGHGERVVMRLLDKQAGRLDLTQLGMDAETLRRTDELIHKPHGILLVTGPTGSGKTTTLYAALARLNDRTRNIMTVEDPIEYYLEGIGQMQVAPKVDMSFARGLRAILRQDPDVVMVGEMRDLETARTGVQASLTGHVVFSTLHTNSAIGAVTRLRDVGIEPFLLASSLLGVLAQRLVRCLCPECREAFTASAADCATFGHESDAPPRLYRATGCAACNNTGYRGRTGIYELVSVDESMREAIHEDQSESRLVHLARRHSQSLREDGWEKALAGVTSLEEVLRVTRED